MMLLKGMKTLGNLSRVNAGLAKLGADPHKMAVQRGQLEALVANAIKRINAKESTAIDAIDYDYKTMVLQVRFMNGGEYSYSNVPSHTVLTWSNSPSLGTYFVDMVRDKYPFTRAS